MSLRMISNPLSSVSIGTSQVQFPDGHPVEDGGRADEGRFSGYDSVDREGPSVKDARRGCPDLGLGQAEEPLAFSPPRLVVDAEEGAFEAGVALLLRREGADVVGNDREDAFFG